MATTIRMPEILAGSSEAVISTWFVHQGDDVAAGAPLAEVETEKASVEFPSDVSGTVLEVLVGEGETVAVGTPIVVIGAPGETSTADAGTDSPTAGQEEQVAEQAPVPEPESATEPVPSPAAGTPTELPARGSTDAPRARTAAGGQRLFSSPLVRRLARERGLDLAQVSGSGPGGRIVRRDLDALPGSSGRTSPEAPASVPAAAAQADPVVPATPARSANTTPATPADPGYEEVPLSGMRRAIARRLTESKSTVPHFYVAADVRMDDLLALRREVNAALAEGAAKASVNDFLVKAVAAAFVRVPQANATWGETVVRRHSRVDVAIAVAVDDGLLTPVLRSVDTLSLGGVSRGAADLVERARAGRLRQHELEGGGSTISNLGMFGVKEFSAILNPPQSVILAVGAAAPRPVVEDGQVVVRTVMTVTMSADHRVVDGALAARWLAAFVEVVENPLRILL